ncbi:MAG: CvpA family protein [Bacteroidota bacterium]
MNHIDIILSIPLVIGALRGFMKGFIREAASLGGLIAGIYFAAIFAETVGIYITQYLSWDQGTIKIVAFVMILIVVLIVVNIVARIIEKIFKMVGLNFLNRMAGVVAGTLKIAFILSIILIFFNYINRNEMLMSKKTQEESFLYNPLSRFAPSVIPSKNFLQYDKTEKKENKGEPQII